MTTEQLIIDGVTIPVDKGISTVLTFSIKDIQQPDKVKSSFSKTIKLPGSKAINDKLNFVFEVNSDSTFNPNLKLDAVYYQNDIAVFSGFIQLKDIHKKDYNQVEYSVVLFGETANIFRELGNKFLNDAGMLWSELDHDYTRAIQENSWDTSYIRNGAVTSFALGSGYVYPMINYGNDTEISVYNVNEMFPAVYAKEYIDRMFADSGYTYTSAFFNASLFKHLIIPFNGKEFKNTQTDLSPRRVNVNSPLFVSNGLDNFTIIPTQVSNPANTPVDTYRTNQVKFTNEVVDANNQYNPTTGVLTVGATGLYGVNLDFTVQGIFDFTGASPTFDIESQSRFTNIFKIKVNGITQNALTSQITRQQVPAGSTVVSTSLTPAYPDSDFLDPSQGFSFFDRNYNPPNRYFLNTDIQLNSGDTIEIFIDTGWRYINQAFPPAGLVPTWTGANGFADFTIKMLTGSLSLRVLDSHYLEGDTIEIASTIPDKVKQRDFLTSIIKMFNLYMIPDENNPKNIIIEPRADFYTTDVIDWSDKLDYSQEHTLTPTAVTNKQKYRYAYKQDADYYNKKYESSWLDVYGTRDVYLENDFNKTEHKTELIFSPTPMVGQLANNRVISTIIDVDNTLQQKTIKSNIRILYYSGLKDSSNNWIHEANAGDVYRGEYPYAAHFNDPFTPTIDINFGLPREIYYDNTYGSITVTNNNLYNTYHRKELEQLTDKDSKIFKGYFLLNPVDIANLSFRPSYFFDNEYWTLHKVMYSSSIYQPSKCEFLKLKAVPTPTVITEEIIGGLGTIGDEATPIMFEDVLSGNNVINMKSNHVDGLDNFIDKSAMFVDIKGDSNKVFTDSKNITIQGDNNVIESNLENITLINTNGVTVTESNVTYVNGEIRGTGSVVSITADTTATEEVKLYLCDASGGNIDVTLPTNPTQGKTWNFKKVGSSNTVRVKSSAPVLIDGSDTTSLTANHKSVVVQFDGINYKIIE